MRKKQQAIVPASVEKFTLPTFGDQLDVAIHDHTLYVPLKRVCDHLGVSLSIGQYQRLKGPSGQPCASCKCVAEDGKRRDTVVIKVNAIPMWLAKLQVSRVKEGLRPKLTWYQKQARDVLAKAFLPTFEEAAHEVCDDLSEIKEVLKATSEGLKVVVAVVPLVHAHEAKIAALEAEVTYLKAAVKDTLLALKEASEESEFGSKKRPFKKPFTFSSAMEWLFGGVA